MSDTRFLLARRGTYGGVKGFLERTFVRLSLHLRRLAAMGAGTAELRGLIGIAATLVGWISLLLSLLWNLLRRGWRKTYRKASQTVENLIRWERSHNKFRYELYNTWLQLQSQHSRRQRDRIKPMILMACATILIISGACFGVGFRVSLNGETIGYVRDRSEIAEVVDRVEKRVSAYRGEQYSLDADFDYGVGYLDRSYPVDTEALEDTLFASVPDEDRYYLLMVDEEPIGACSSSTAIRLMLRRILLNSCSNAVTVNTAFVNDVRIQPVNADSVELMPIKDMEEALTSNKEEKLVYTVVAGDTLSGIGARYDMKIAEIQALNPNADFSKLRPGMELVLSAAVPRLSVKQTVTERYTQSIPFQTVIEYDANMYKNKSTMKVVGENGSADVVADVTYVNGVETERNVISYTVTKEPVNAVKVVGTKDLPRTAATGKFIKPSGGRFTSGFGRRPSLKDTHTGVDYAGAVGTNIWAADGGTVIWAGQKGNYGKHIIIDHGNGYVTYYCHCSKLLVSKGDKVAQGDIIAKVGSTGRVTGPHLHFEIRYNGKPQNPLKYVSK